MRLEEMDVVSLKAVAYDVLAKIQDLQSTLQMVNGLIQKKLSEKIAVPEVPTNNRKEKRNVNGALTKEEVRK